MLLFVISCCQYQHHCLLFTLPQLYQSFIMWIQTNISFCCWFTAKVLKWQNTECEAVKYIYLSLRWGLKATTCQKQFFYSQRLISSSTLPKISRHKLFVYNYLTQALRMWHTAEHARLRLKLEDKCFRQNSNPEQSISIIHKGKTGDSGWWNDAQRKIIDWRLYLKNTFVSSSDVVLSKSYSRRSAGHIDQPGLKP